MRKTLPPIVVLGILVQAFAIVVLVLALETVILLVAEDALDSAEELLALALVLEDALIAEGNAVIHALAVVQMIAVKIVVHPLAMLAAQSLVEMADSVECLAGLNVQLVQAHVIVTLVLEFVKMAAEEAAEEAVKGTAVPLAQIIVALDVLTVVKPLVQDIVVQFLLLLLNKKVFLCNIN